MPNLKPEDLTRKLLNLCQSNEVLDRSKEVVDQIVTELGADLYDIVQDPDEDISRLKIVEWAKCFFQADPSKYIFPSIGWGSAHSIALYILYSDQLWTNDADSIFISIRGEEITLSELAYEFCFLCFKNYKNHPNDYSFWASKAFAFGKYFLYLSELARLFWVKGILERGIYKRDEDCLRDPLVALVKVNVLMHGTPEEALKQMVKEKLNEGKWVGYLKEMYHANACAKKLAIESNDTAQLKGVAWGEQWINEIYGWLREFL